MSLSNPYHWVSDLAPRARRRIVLSAGASMALVAGLTMAAVLVPAGAGNAAPPPDYAEVGGPCENTTFFQTYGAGADGSPASYFRYRFLSSYEINGSPSSRYWRYVHLEERWSGTEWVADPDRRTVQTWYCDTPAPVPSTSSPTPSPTPTDPSTSPTPSPTPPPAIDCGAGGTLTREQADQLIAAGAVPAADPCDLRVSADELQVFVAGPPHGVLLGQGRAVWEVWEDQRIVSANQSSRCVKLRSYVPVNTNIGQIGVIVIEQYICKSRDPVQGDWVVSDGTFDTATNTWRAPKPPQVSIKDPHPLIGLQNGGIGGNGVTFASVVPANGVSAGKLVVQVQLIAGINFGIPKSEGGSFALSRTLTKDYSLAAVELPSP